MAGKKKELTEAQREKLDAELLDLADKRCGLDGLPYEVVSGIDSLDLKGQDMKEIKTTLKDYGIDTAEFFAAATELQRAWKVVSKASAKAQKAVDKRIDAINKQLENNC